MLLNVIINSDLHVKTIPCQALLPTTIYIFHDVEIVYLWSVKVSWVLNARLTLQ